MANNRKLLRPLLVLFQFQEQVNRKISNLTREKHKQFNILGIFNCISSHDSCFTVKWITFEQKM